MSIIANPSVYSSANPYLYTGETHSAGSADPVNGSDKTEDADAQNDAVTVSLSEDVTDARVRENLGLTPTGRLTLGQFEAAADAQEETVKRRLAEILEAQGLDPEMSLTLSVDSDHDIIISESFPGKSKLQKALNNDPEFELAFKQMTSNREVAGYATSLTQRNTSLVNYMSGESSWEDILSMAKKYDSITSGPANLTSLLGWSKTEAPYTYEYVAET